MAATIQEQVVQAFEITKEEEIAAPMGIVFEAILEQMGPLNSTPEKPMPMNGHDVSGESQVLARTCTLPDSIATWLYGG